MYNERTRSNNSNKIQLVLVILFILGFMIVGLLSTPSTQMTLAAVFKPDTYQIMEAPYTIEYKDGWSSGYGHHRRRRYLFSAWYAGEDVFQDKYKHPTFSVTHVTSSVYNSGDVGDTVILQWLYNKKTDEIVERKYKILCRPK